MSKKIVAIGGGYNGRVFKNGKRTPYETGPMDEEIIKLTNKKKPHVLILAHSQLLENQDYYFEVMKKIYLDMYNCPCKQLKSNELTNKKYVKELIEWSDIIYECGGNTLDMIKLWKDTGFDKILKSAWQKGKVMCGLSAGANCWFNRCSSDSLKIKYGPEEPLISMECLGFYEGFFVPHCDEKGREETAKEMLKETNEIGLLLSNCAALEIVDNKYRIIVSDGKSHKIKPYALKTYWLDDIYHEEQIEITQEFKELKELYRKGE